MAGLPLSMMDARSLKSCRTPASNAGAELFPSSLVSVSRTPEGRLSKLPLAGMYP
ncbi:Uncharacterised protein [Mycobacteroides abscessus subsp. abscessus]|nr:Uncharacterised protein [Mycobacteroides abscessus subsp. abscessus]